MDYFRDFRMQRILNVEKMHNENELKVMTSQIQRILTTTYPTDFRPFQRRDLEIIDYLCKNWAFSKFRKILKATELVCDDVPQIVQHHREPMQFTIPASVMQTRQGSEISTDFLCRVFSFASLNDNLNLKSTCPNDQSSHASGQATCDSLNRTAACRLDRAEKTATRVPDTSNPEHFIKYIKQ